MQLKGSWGGRKLTNGEFLGCFVLLGTGQLDVDPSSPPPRLSLPIRFARITDKQEDPPWTSVAPCTSVALAIAESDGG